MKPFISKVRPAAGFSRFAHVGLVGLMPILVLSLVYLELAWLALVIILLSKWRIFAVKPRFWWANVRANGVDIMVSLASLTFLLQTDSFVWRLIWTSAHIIWLIAIRPHSGSLMVGVQALVGFLFGLGALFLLGDQATALVLVLATGTVCYLAAHHFFDAFDERYTRTLSFFWAFFGAALVWVLSHWLIYYPTNGVVSQPMLLLLTIGYGLATLYYLDHTQRLTVLMRNQFIFIMVAITVLILVFSDWSDKIV